MRISCWSSDVCSSYLRHGCPLIDEARTCGAADESCAKLEIVRCVEVEVKARENETIVAVNLDRLQYSADICSALGARLRILHAHTSGDRKAVPLPCIGDVAGSNLFGDRIRQGCIGGGDRIVSTGRVGRFRCGDQDVELVAYRRIVEVIGRLPTPQSLERKSG